MRRAWDYWSTGSIPACAGEAQLGGGRGRRRRVYPRVCGGSKLVGGDAVLMPGLSPRVRGKLRLGVADQIWLRSIPACAGEAAGCRGVPGGPEVYPRVCGGSWCSSGWIWTRKGLSPRVRGKRGLQAIVKPPSRSIPACAGEADGRWAFRSGSRVYPRVCGGSRQKLAMTPSWSGLSPRVRGKRRRPVSGRSAGRSIPACAGEAAGVMSWVKMPLRAVRVYPRVCGGSFDNPRGEHMERGLSPRVRGKPADRGSGQRLSGSIPACAGEARNSWGYRSSDKVYPRVCGGSITTRAG